MQPSKHQSAGFGHEDSVTGSCQQIIFIATVVHPRPDRLAGRFDFSNRRLQFIQPRPADFHAINMQDHALDRFVARCLMQSIHAR